MFPSILAAHILGAVATFAIIFYAMIALLRSQSRQLEALAGILGILAAFEVVSGVALAIISNTVTVVSVCDNIALYLALVLVTQAALYTRMRGTGVRFPVVRSLSPVCGSICLLVLSAALGF